MSVNLVQLWLRWFLVSNLAGFYRHPGSGQQHSVGHRVNKSSDLLLLQVALLHLHPACLVTCDLAQGSILNLSRAIKCQVPNYQSTEKDNKELQHSAIRRLHGYKSLVKAPSEWDWKMKINPSEPKRSNSSSMNIRVYFWPEDRLVDVPREHGAGGQHRRVRWRHDRSGNGTQPEERDPLGCQILKTQRQNQPAIHRKHHLKLSVERCLSLEYIKNIVKNLSQFCNSICNASTET